MLDFKLIKEIAKDGTLTQRALSKMFVVSLGKINAELAKLLYEGFIEIKESPGGRKGKYILTAKGGRYRRSLAKSYLNKRQLDSSRIKQDISELKSELKKTR